MGAFSLIVAINLLNRFMATRSLTEVFILMRNNAIQHRQFFAKTVEDSVSDRTALVADEESFYGSRVPNGTPPEWADTVEDIQYNISKIQQRLKELQSMHDKRINRPSLDDDFSSDHGIEALTQEITQMFLHCQKSIQTINRCATDVKFNFQDRKLAKNVVSSLASSLQSLSTQFKQAQSDYLKKLKSREERSRFFAFEPLDSNSNDDRFASSYDQNFSDAQMQALMDNTEMVEEREREITNIVQSITELNSIFRDLAQMIVDQGTVLDRIDYNVEHASFRTEQGLKQLQKAETYQKKNRKMMCIIVLGVLACVMFILLVATKF